MTPHLLVVLLASLAPVSYSSTMFDNFRMKFDPTELYFIAESAEYAQEVFEAADLMNKIVILWTTFDHELDPYFKIYLEYMLELTRDTQSVHVILSGIPRRHDLFRDALKHVPRKTLFVLIQDQVLLYDICLLSAARYYLGHTRATIFHMNHEQPWNLNRSFGLRTDGNTCHASHLPSVYSNYQHVFRNYYFEPFASVSQYVPLLSLRPRELRLYNAAHSMIPSSQRPRWCVFAGRIQYAEDNGGPSVFNYERDEFLRIITSESHIALGDKACQAVYDLDGRDGHSYTFEQYIEKLSETVFTPCPAGNSPETFRHYEAMEMGSIPLIVRPPSHSDFLNMWVGYPGPIFDNWTDAIDFAMSVDAASLDDLQQRISVWYDDYRDNTFKNFSSTLNRIFDMEWGSQKSNVSALSRLRSNAPSEAENRLIEKAIDRRKEHVSPAPSPATCPIQESQLSYTQMHAHIEALEEELKQIKKAQDVTLDKLEDLYQLFQQRFEN